MCVSIMLNDEVVVQEISCVTTHTHTHTSTTPTHRLRSARLFSSRHQETLGYYPLQIETSSPPEHTHSSSCPGSHCVFPQWWTEISCHGNQHTLVPGNVRFFMLLTETSTEKKRQVLWKIVCGLMQWRANKTHTFTWWQYGTVSTYAMVMKKVSKTCLQVIILCLYWAFKTVGKKSQICTLKDLIHI